MPPEVLLNRLLCSPRRQYVDEVLTRASSPRNSTQVLFTRLLRHSHRSTPWRNSKPRYQDPSSLGVMLAAFWALRAKAEKQ